MEMERGPRYEAYAQLRETKLRMKYLRQIEDDDEEEEQPKIPTPPKKQFRFQYQYQYQAARITKGSSLLAQSVPDFSAALRKENRKPVVNTVMELTPPPPLKTKRGYGYGGVLSTSRGTKSVNNTGEKRRVAAAAAAGGGSVLVARKSYANIAEIRGGGGGARMVF